MTIYKIGASTPEIHETAYVAAEATITGQVKLGARTSVWPGAVIRADNDTISIGDRSNVQEGAILHVDPGKPLAIGDGVTIGHQAMLHGCTIGAGSLIGIQAVVLNGAVIGKNCLVGAGALVTENKTFPDGSLIMGTPAKLVRELTPQAIEELRTNAETYVRHADNYRQNLEMVSTGKGIAST
ncbi:MAG: gamma carbonic anhydrase family protein [Proteobacteria bacterium]|nr:gamma carbonic anhydrase family protein [Pseudomonadota bacterium]